MSTDPIHDPLLAVESLWKSYGQVVLADVSLVVQRGEVHALVGENGAGKSTLSRILAGMTAPDRGTLRLHGLPYAPKSKQEAEQAGVRIVLQELNLIPTLTVAESLFLDELPHRWGWIDRRQLHEQARAALDAFGLESVDPDQWVGALGIGQQQLVEIAAGLRQQDTSNLPEPERGQSCLPPGVSPRTQRCNLLILDEPTAALTAPEVELLFARILELKARGTGVLYISHRLEEIRRIADRLTVLRDGRVVATADASSAPLNQVVRWMVGREVEAPSRGISSGAGPVALRVEGLFCGSAVQDVSFEARAGEILGFAGLMGSGRTETLRAVFGADTRDAGDVFVGEERHGVPAGSPRASVEAGMAFLTEDRKGQGLFLPLPVRSNISLSRLSDLGRRGGWIREDVERQEAESWQSQLSIRCANLEQPIVELSGGNQQKALLARWLARDASIFLFDEPTRGIDVGAREEIHEMLRTLADAGKALAVVSSDLKELLAISDRIAVMSAGRLAATFTRGEWTEDAIMAAALSGYQTKASP